MSQVSEIISTEENLLDTSELDITFEDNVVPPSLSPATPAESFFLSAELQNGTSQISAFALASQIHLNTAFNRSSRHSGSSTVVTDDYQSACEDIDIHDQNVFDNDVLVIASEPIPEDSLEYAETMSFTSSFKSSTPTKVVTKPVDSPAPAPAQEDAPNVTQHVYDGAKGVWAWGKGVGVISPFMGIAEAVVDKAVHVAGTNFEEIDGTLKKELGGLDEKFVNPAVEALVKFLTSTVSKSDETLRPVVMMFLGPFLKMIEDKPDETPEVTP